MEIIEIPSPPAAEPVVQPENISPETVATETTPLEQTTDAPVETPAIPEATPAETFQPEPLKPLQPAAVAEPTTPVAEPDYSPEAILERYQGNEKALLQALGYNDFLIDAIEYGKRTGNDLAAYWEAKHINWNDRDRLPDEKVMELKLKEQYAQYQIPEAQVNKMVQRELRDTYKIGEDFDPMDEDVEMARLKLQMEAYKVRTEKVQQQAQFKAPEAPAQEAPPPPEVVKAKNREILFGDDSVKGFLQTKTVKFGDYTLPVEDPEVALAPLYDDRAYVLSMVKRDAQGQPVLQNGQPVMDRSKQIKLALYAQHMDRIEQDLINYGKTLGKKAVEEEAEVIPRRESGTPSAGQGGDVMDGVFDALRRKAYGG